MNRKSRRRVVRRHEMGSGPNRRSRAEPSQLTSDGSPLQSPQNVGGWSGVEILGIVLTSLLLRVRTEFLEAGREDEDFDVRFVFATRPTKLLYDARSPPPGSRHDEQDVNRELNRVGAVAMLRASVETVTLTGFLAVGIARPTKRLALVASLERPHAVPAVWFALIERSPEGAPTLGAWMVVGDAGMDHFDAGPGSTHTN